jgi:hypothetical protein
MRVLKPRSTAAAGPSRPGRGDDEVNRGYRAFAERIKLRRGVKPVAASLGIAKCRSALTIGATEQQDSYQREECANGTVR